VTVATSQSQPGQVAERRTESGAPKDCVGALPGAAGPGDPVRDEVIEGGRGGRDAPIAGQAKRGHHDDVAERGHTPDVWATCIQRPSAGGCDIERDATVDVAEQEPGRSRG